MKKKACRNCKIFVDGETCPVCKGSQFVLNWKGRYYILDSAKSMIGKKLGVTIKGEYAIKVS